MYQRHLVGKFGEKTIQDYLIAHDYFIMEHNFYCRFGEMDIIAKDIKKDELVFIEVKTRRNYSYGMPAESITNVKKRHIRKVAEYFLYKYHLENEFVRFDVIEVVITDIENHYYINHIKQAF